MKFFKYILIAIALIGLFGPTVSVDAQYACGFCWKNGTVFTGADFSNPQTQVANCTQANGKWQYPGQTSPIPPYGPQTPTVPLSCTNTNPPSDTCAPPREIVNGECTTPYKFLAPITGSDGTGTGDYINPAKDNALSNYINLMIKIFIGISAVLAVVMIVMGGIEYVTSELSHSKEHGKETITNAVFGLLIALGAYALLNTINPDLLRTNISIEGTTIENIPSYNNSAVVKGSGNCAVAPTGSNCSPSNLSIFGNRATDASKICMVESSGNASSSSGSDKCGSTVFSYGLFQINLVANGNIVQDSSGNSCTGLFEMSDGSPINGNSYIKKNSGVFAGYDCRLKSGQNARLASCAATLQNPAKNAAIAYSLFQKSSRPFGAWYYSDRARCGEELFK